MRQSRGHYHAHGDRLAVPELFVTGQRLYGVGKGVPEVKYAPDTTFPFVLHNDLGLGNAGTLNVLDKRLSVRGRRRIGQGPRIVLDELEKTGVTYNAVFHDLGQTGVKFPLVERSEEHRVGKEGRSRW